MEDRAKSAEARREFLRTAGKAAVAAPAVALLLSARVTPAQAGVAQYQVIVDDIQSE